MLKTSYKMDILKHCPFCGAEPYMHELICEYDNGNKKSVAYYVTCQECGAVCNYGFETKEEAVKWWNRRKEEKSFSKLMERMRLDKPSELA